MKKLLFLFLCFTLASTSAFSQDDTYYTDDESSVTVKADVAPPPLPDYVQPPCPEDGYIWTPGYWAWGITGYYWVPGVWVLPPAVGLLWTPGYWGFYHGYYGWHHGYWGPHIGYYGGVNYGFGYYGTGFYGGRWEGGHFMYNTAVWHVNHNIHNVYVNREVVHPVAHTRASFNGPNGVHYRPAAHEIQAMHETHVERSPMQVQHEHNMAAERGQFHSPTTHPAVHSMSAPGGMRYNQGGHPVGGGHPSGGRPGGGGGHPGGGHVGGGGHGGGRR